jgi:hypothetical protein
MPLLNYWAPTMRILIHIMKKLLLINSSWIETYFHSLKRI